MTNNIKHQQKYTKLAQSCINSAITQISLAQETKQDTILSDSYITGAKAYIMTAKRYIEHVKENYEEAEEKINQTNNNINQKRLLIVLESF